MTLNERAAHFLRVKYPDFVEEGSTCAVGICELCGRCRWQSCTDKGKGFKVVVEVQGYPSCEKCQEVSHRAPEIFIWVLRVLSMQKDAAEEAARAAKEEASP